MKPYIDGKNVEYIGSANPKRRDELLRNAYALLHPINFEEPFGLSVVESMACGTPVVAFNKGSMKELISDGKTGFLVNNIKEAIESINKVYKIDRKYCREWVEKRFTRERMVDDYINVYKKILEAKEF